MPSIIAMQDSYPIEAIDLCEFQDYSATNQFIGIDFKLAKTTRASIRLMMVKMGEGSWNGYNDATFEAQLLEAMDAGFDGVPYHFDHMEIDVREQSAYIKQRVHGRLRGSGPMMEDFEDEDQTRFQHPQKPLTSADIKARTPTALLMHDHMRDQMDATSQITGVPTIGYTGAYYCEWYLWLASLAGRDLSWTKLYPWHIATYRVREMWVPAFIPVDNVVLWQWNSVVPTDKQVKGFPNPSRLDMNYWLKSPEAYAKMFNSSIVLPPPQKFTWAQQITAWARNVPGSPYIGADPESA
jgi:hypothetical protein